VPAAVAAPKPAPVATPAPPRKIVSIVKSVPSDAQVVSAADGRVLGKTAWIDEREASPGTLELVLKHPGYTDGHATLDLSKYNTLRVTLEPKAPRPRPAAPKSQASSYDDLQILPLK
jgi:hypothetical protein